MTLWLSQVSLNARGLFLQRRENSRVDSLSRCFSASCPVQELFLCCCIEGLLHSANQYLGHELLEPQPHSWEVIQLELKVDVANIDLCFEWATLKLQFSASHQTGRAGVLLARPMWQLYTQQQSASNIYFMEIGHFALKFLPSADLVLERLNIRTEWIVS